MEILTRRIYEFLASLWLMRWKKSTWVYFLINVFKILPYGFFKERVIGKYSLHLDPGDKHDSLYYFSSVGFSYETLLRKIINPGDIVFDVGASVGHFSCLAAKYVGGDGRVYSFEANLKSYEKLEKSVAGFPMGPIRIYNVAVWSSSGDMPFYVADNSGWSSLRQHPDPVKQSFNLKEIIQVKAISLDEFFESENIKQVRMLKLDIEGGESDALIGSRKILAGNSVNSIFMEYSTRGLEAFDRRGTETHKMLMDFGFIPVLMVESDKIRPFDVFPSFDAVKTFDLFYVCSSMSEEIKRSLLGEY
jgi:FkbM family methyltransferase